MWRKGQKAKTRSSDRVLNPPIPSVTISGPQFPPLSLTVNTLRCVKRQLSAWTLQTGIGSNSQISAPCLGLFVGRDNHQSQQYL